MRLIEIQSWNELEEKLANLKGKDYLYIKIKCKKKKATINAINLKQFSGTIDICFDNDGVYEITVLTDCNKNNTFFTNVNKVAIVVDRRPFLKLNYKKIEVKPRAIHSEEEILDNNIPMVLTENVCLTKTLPKLSERQINGNNFVVYLSKDNINDVKYFYNANFIIYDKIIFINEVKDFYTLKEIRKGNILVVLNKSISNFAMKSVDLIEFTGNLYLLGNDNYLKNGTIFNKGKNVGLFGSVNSCANIYIENLGMNHLIFAGKVPYYCGCFIGNRETTKFYSREGELFFKNCYVKNCVLPKPIIENGVLVGNPNLYYGFVNILASDNFCGSKEIYFNDYLNEHRLIRKNKN